VEACRRNDLSDSVLASYERRWKADFGRELELGLRVFLLRQQLSPADIDRLVSALNDPAIIAEICQYGDMDRPGAIIRRLVRNPGVIPAIGILLRGELYRIFKG
jgi:flavin-dependent dehydrogenase